MAVLIGGTDAHYVANRGGTFLPHTRIQVRRLSDGSAVTPTAPGDWEGQPFPAGDAITNAFGFYRFLVPDATGVVEIRPVTDAGVPLGSWRTPSMQIIPGSEFDRAFTAPVDEQVDAGIDRAIADGRISTGGEADPDKVVTPEGTGGAIFVLPNDPPVDDPRAVQLLPTSDLLTSTEAASTYAPLSRFRAEPAEGTYTDGDRVAVGRYAFIPDGIGTAYVQGGASNYENIIGGNTANVNTPASNLTGAPALTAQNGNWSAILAGYDNVVNGWACVVTGFHNKVEMGSNHATISGGSIQTVTAGGFYGTIAGGTRNTVSAESGVVSGGADNVAAGYMSAIGGGSQNDTTDSHATVGGGYGNTASAPNSTVAGGNTGTASANSATVGGGLVNAATATGATVPGGRENTAAKQYAIATGRGAIAHDAAEHAHGAGVFSAQGDAQARMWVARRETTNATAQDLIVEDGAAPFIREHQTLMISALLVARRADVDGEGAGWRLDVVVQRNAGNTTSVIGTPTITKLAASTGAAAWSVAFGTYSIGTLRFIVTGEAGKTIRWVGKIDAAAVIG